MSDTISLRDHSLPCEHDDAVRSSVVDGLWVCNHLNQWGDFDCLGGKERTFRQLWDKTTNRPIDGLWVEVADE